MSQITRTSVNSLPFVVPSELSDQDLFNPLPAKVRDDIDSTLLALEEIHQSRKVNPAVKRLAASLALHRPITFNCLRRKYYDYLKSGGDWRVLVDWTRVPRHARPGQAEASDQEKLPPDFIQHLQGLMQSNQRKSAPAIRALYRSWKRGHSIPVYGTWQEWFQSQNPHEPLPRVCPPDLPRGWSRGNLRRYIPEAAELALTREGVAAALQHLPDILSTRAGLRPLEYVMFDDVRTDFKILVPGAGPVELNLLVALDVATGRVLRYGMCPAITRQDGMKDKLKLRDMKTLVAGLLQQYGIPRGYVMNFVVENATAAIRDGFAMALAELSCGRIAVHRTMMVCGTAIWAGYKDKAIGSPQGKAPLESTFNLFHNEAGFLPGQTGRRYDAGPRELEGRSREAMALVQTGRHLSPHERAELKMPFLTYRQARVVLTDLWNQICQRTDHAMEAFEVVGEFRLKEYDQWRPEIELLELDPSLRGQVLWRNPPRKESPMERWDRLVAALPVTGQQSPFEQLHPGALARLYEEHKPVTVIGREIIFTVDKTTHVYRLANMVGRAGRVTPCAPSGLPDKAKALAYYDPHDLSWIHLTDGQGGYLGSLPETLGLKRGDKEGQKAEFDRKRRELHELQDKVSRRLPEQIEDRLSDLDANTQILSEALENAGALDSDPVSASCPEMVGAINKTKAAIATAQTESETEAARIATAPRSLASILAGHESRNT